MARFPYAAVRLHTLSLLPLLRTMRFMLKHSWWPRPLSTFLGCMDIKTGVIITLLFALFNKVAGVYGLIAIFTGGSFAQVSMYIYSIATLLLFLWGLRAVSSENAKETFYFAHMFVCDHIFSTVWLGYFSIEWWMYTAHDGKQTPHSAAQEELIKSALDIPHLTEEERTRIAQELWSKEKGVAATMIVLGWILKIYFALLLYSYALHLRRGTFRSRSQSQYGPVPQSATGGAFDLPGRAEDFELDDRDLYSARSTRHNRTPGTSSSFAEFVNVPETISRNPSNQSDDIVFQVPKTTR